jgi:hypothetical protein
MRLACLALTVLVLAVANAPCQAPASPTVSELMKVLDNKKASVIAREQAAKALGAIGARAEAALPSLVRAIDEYYQDIADRRAKDKKASSSPLYSLSSAAQLAIGKIALAIPASPAPKTAKTVADYAKDLNDREAHTRLAAVKFFQTLYSSSLAGVARAVHDDDEDVRVVAGKAVAAARQSLAKVEPSVQALMDDLKNTDESVRLCAAKKLGTFGKKAAPALAALDEASKDKDEDVARVAKAAIARIKAAKK